MKRRIRDRDLAIVSDRIQRIADIGEIPIERGHAAQEGTGASAPSRDWRRKPALRLRVTKKTSPLVLDQVHALPAHARGRHRAMGDPVGPDGWQDMLRGMGRCTECGKRGVALQHPSWGGSDTGGRRCRSAR